jgi:hypothetical protein
VLDSGRSYSGTKCEGKPIFLLSSTKFKTGPKGHPTKVLTEVNIVLSEERTSVVRKTEMFRKNMLSPSAKYKKLWPNITDVSDQPTASIFIQLRQKGLTIKLHGLKPRANYTDRATAACRRT